MSISRSVRRSIAAALAAGVAITLAACSTPTPTTTDGGEGPGSATLRIGFSPFTLQAPALKGLADALTAVGQAQGDTVTVVDPKADPSTQLQQIQQWVDLGQVDAIWVIPVAPESLAAELTAATGKGIVVVAAGVPEDYGYDGPQAGMTFTNVDNEDYGTKLGKIATDCIAERLDGKGNIIVLQSPIGVQSSTAINTALLAQIAKDSPDSTIVNTQDAAADRLGNSQIIASAIQGAPDANVIIGTDDEATLGALDAATAAGLDPAKVCILGAGGNDEAQASVKDGKLYGEVAFDFQADLGQNLAELHKLAGDPTAEGSQLTTPILLVTP